MVFPTLVLSPRFTPDSIALAGAATQLGWNVERLVNWRPQAELKTQPVVVYGEPLFAAVIARELGLSLVEPPFHWLTTLPVQYCKRDIQFLSLGDAKAINHPAFFKPADDKCFPAKVYQSGLELADFGYLEEDVPVLVSEPVVWEVEFRCFVHHRTLATFSPYSRFGELACDSNGNWPATTDEIAALRQFTDSLLNDWSVSIPEAVVIDVGVISGKGWAVVEANAAFGSGIYGCDPAQVLPVLAEASCHMSQ
ncbi:MAG TPA: ATP-grasp domain-containing protein [Acidobacteriota bacterium]|nr:ATP-grasp domain-containing protein [Acidobacteriota bacterium]